MLRKFPFYDLWERIGFEVVVFAQMGIDQRRWRWWNAVVFIGMVGVTGSNSQEKQKQVVSRIAFGSCSNQSAPQVPKKILFCYAFFSILILLLFILVLFCFVLSLFYFFPHVAVSCNGTCMLMILFLCFNHDVPILVPACCCSPNVTSALSKLQFCCTHLKKKTNNNNAVKKVSCG